MPLNHNSQTKQAAPKRTFILDYLADEVECAYLSDLRIHKNDKLEQLIGAITNLSVKEYALHDWNEALNYLVQLPGQKTAEEAKRLLLSALSDPRSEG